MIAPAKPVRRKKSPPAWHAAFLAMLPAIRQQANYAFRRMRPAAKEDAVTEVVCATCAAFARLVAQGKAHVACPSALTRFAIKQCRAGRRTGNRLRINDVLSPYCQKRKGVKVERLDRFDREEDCWIEAVVPDDSRPVPEQVAFRIDFPAWLATYSERDRKIAEALSIGERTMDVAKRFGLSQGRISQMRNEFHDDWLAFHGENNGDSGGTTAA